MTFELGIAITATLCGVFGILTAWMSRANYRSCRELLEFTGKQIEDLEVVLAQSLEARELDERRLKDQARRIAWLETRIRQPKAATEAVEEKTFQEPLPTANLRANITERRHRILTLASRGQNVETIASTLGMMPGEVQLVMNLNRAQVSFA